jgi:hypothetical protein
MSEEHSLRPRRTTRRKAQEEKAALGWRAGKRTSKAAKRTKSAAKAEEVKGRVEAGAREAGRWLTVGAMGIGAAVAALLVLFLLVNGVNTFARWYVKRRAEEAQKTAQANRLKENVLFIGVQGNQAVGFLALRVDRNGGRVFGLAIPDGAFVEVPGQGFERIGNSYASGAKTSVAAVANYLSVPFERYVVIDADTYRNALKNQNVSQLMVAPSGTNLDQAEADQLRSFLGSVPSANVGLAPLPVRAVTIGQLTYYEPQRDQIADLLLSWWGVHLGSGPQPFRVIIYNGAGKPEVAGDAAEQLIKEGFKVPDTGNASNFNYAKTQIVMFRGTNEDAKKIHDLLGAGVITRQSTDQNIADAIVIIGKDYTPPPKGH